MLSKKTSRSLVSGRTRWSALATAAFVLIPLSAVRVGTQSNGTPEPNTLREFMPMNFTEIKNAMRYDWQKPRVILNRGKWVRVGYPYPNRSSKKDSTSATEKSASSKHHDAGDSSLIPPTAAANDATVAQSDASWLQRQRLSLRNTSWAGQPAKIDSVIHLNGDSPNDKIVELFVKAGPTDTLFIDVPPGSRVIVNGWNENSARVRASITGHNAEVTRVYLDRRANGFRLFSVALVDGLALTRDTTGEFPRMNVRIPYAPNALTPSMKNNNKNEFELWIPKKAAVKVQSKLGSFAVLETEGAISAGVKSASGCVTAEFQPKGAKSDFLDFYNRLTTNRDPIIVVDGIVQEPDCGGRERARLPGQPR